MRIMSLFLLVLLSVASSAFALETHVVLLAPLVVALFWRSETQLAHALEDMGLLLTRRRWWPRWAATPKDTL